MAESIDRRQFLGRALAGGVALSGGVSALARADSPNERVVVGVVGMGRGRGVARTFARQSHCTVKYVCDVDRSRADAGAGSVAEVADTAPEAVTDLRRILDDREVDAVALALPVHWHAPATILACDAGKHVYVEKPCCHNPREGELMVKAARKHRRAVQMGNQRRSWPKIREGMARLHDGVIGRVYYSRGWYAATRGSIGRGREAAVPERLDYELWQGPAPRRPYRDNVVHYNWHWLWHWGSGEVGNNGSHALDLCRWGLGVDYPVRVTSAGGRYRYDDDQETPDTHVLSFDFEADRTILWEGLSCNRPGLGGTGFGASFFGEEGSLVVDGAGYRIYDGAGDLLEQESGGGGDAGHVGDLLSAIRQEQPLHLRSEIEEGYKSTLLCHLGNIAHRVGRSLHCDPADGRILDDREAMGYWEREYEPGWEPSV